MADASSPTLRRELGRWDLTAIGVNQVIGGAVFLMPASVAAAVGGWSPLLVAAVGGVSLIVALSFAEVGSRFAGTGGPYLYARAAFGRFVSLEVGWMQWFTRAASWASVVNGLMDSLSFYWPALLGRGARGALIAALIVGMTWINVRGIRLSSWTINALTIGKIVPLVAYTVIGLAFLDAARLAPGPLPGGREFATATVLLIFAFGGYEVVPVTGGETRDPHRAIPFAMVMTILLVTAVMTGAQVVALGTLPDLASSRTALADSAVTFLGGAGALLITLAAVFSMTGNNFGQSLSGSRNLFALGEHGDIPRFFAWVHPRYRTPANAVLVTSAVVLALALTGTFATLAAGSAVSRLIVYAATCASTLALRRERFATVVRPAAFVVPGGAVIPTLGCILPVVILFFVTPRQIVVGAAALAAGAALYGVTRLATRGMPAPRENYLEEV
ncbi:MAG TPA: APC family permease [Vicinamibacterales bacterium]|nr:APC family permease [Vicinamibacterales bacterium]